MHLYIAIQSTYDVFEMGLFINNTLTDQINEDKRHTSKLFIPLLEQLLTRNSVLFSDISFCAVNCGPAPFSTLRSIIASMNGLHYATKIPLISIDGLEATFSEFYNPAYKNTVVTLNAFNNESYYLIASGNHIVATGYKKTELLPPEIAEKLSTDSVNSIDNKVCSLETIGKLGYSKFMAHEAMPSYLTPLHLKKHPVEEKKNQ